MGTVKDSSNITSVYKVTLKAILEIPATPLTGQICNVPRAKILPKRHTQCANFHALIITGTIPPNFCMYQLDYKIYSTSFTLEEFETEIYTFQIESCVSGYLRHSLTYTRLYNN